MDPKGTVSARQHSISVSVKYRDVTYDLGIWDTWSGGNISSESTKHRRGAMGKQVAVSGSPTIEDVTISRDYDLKRDHDGQDASESPLSLPDGADLAHFMSGVVGRAQVTAKKYYMDADAKTFGKPIIVTGILMGYNQPEGDSDSSDVAMVEIVINPDGEIA